jgi:glutamyl-tRNA synthetase
VAWLFARSSSGRFLVRMEDLDLVTADPAHEAQQLGDLAALGLDWDGEVVRQSDRFDRYRAAIDRLTERGLTYPCYCTRREIREAARAPHDGPVPDGAYPGTCRDLGPDERRRREAHGRRPALRLRAQVASVGFVDRLAGPYEALVDDLVLRRNDGVPAYNLAVVVDDAAQGVDEVVRGDDLLSSTPRQIHLARLLDLPVPSYAHVPLVLGPEGRRLAKRDGAVTLAERPEPPPSVRDRLAASLGLIEDGEHAEPAALIDRFDPERLSRAPWRLEPGDLAAVDRP